MPQRQASRCLHARHGECVSFTGRTIIKDIRILAAAILAGFSIAAQAQSGDGLPETHFRFGIQAGTVRDHHESTPVAQFSLGYDINSLWAVEALFNGSLLFERDGGLGTGDRAYDDALGVRVLATLPLGERWRLIGGLGVVRTQYDVADVAIRSGLPFASHYTATKNGPIVSLAAMYKLGRRWSLGLEASSFTQESSFNLGLRGEFHF